MPYEPPPELAELSLAEIAALAAERKLPPLESWSPQATGDSEMRIAADGRWFHDGGEIVRPAMIRAFASLLMRDGGGQHWLVTPQQKLSVDVEDAALVAVDLRHDGEALAFRFNTDELTVAGPEHPLRIAGTVENPAIYLHVRHGIEARLNRSTWMQLADIADSDMAVSSKGMRFCLLPR